MLRAGVLSELGQQTLRNTWILTQNDNGPNGASANCSETDESDNEYDSDVTDSGGER